MLGVVCTVLFTNSTSWTHKVDTPVDPQEYPPIITLEEWVGKGGTTVDYTEEVLFSKMYSYYEYGDGNWIRYNLYVSDQEWLLRSFKHSKVDSTSQYHYNLQTEGAALAIEVSEELSPEWLQRLSERLENLECDG